MADGLSNDVIFGDLGYLQGHSSVAILFKCDCSYICTTNDSISKEIWRGKVPLRQVNLLFAINLSVRYVAVHEKNNISYF